MTGPRLRVTLGWALLALGLWQAGAGALRIGGDLARRSERARRATWTLPERERFAAVDPGLAAIVALVETRTPPDATVWCVGPSEPDHLATIRALQIVLWPRWFHSVEALPPALPPSLGARAAERETFVLSPDPLGAAWGGAAEPAGEARGSRLWRLTGGAPR